MTRILIKDLKEIVSTSVKVEITDGDKTLYEGTLIECPSDLDNERVYETDIKVKGLLDIRLLVEIF